MRLPYRFSSGNHSISKAAVETKDVVHSKRFAGFGTRKTLNVMILIYKWYFIRRPETAARHVGGGGGKRFIILFVLTRHLVRKGEAGGVRQQVLERAGGFRVESYPREEKEKETRKKTARAQSPHSTGRIFFSVSARGRRRIRRIKWINYAPGATGILTFRARDRRNPIKSLRTVPGEKKRAYKKKRARFPVGVRARVERRLTRKTHIKDVEFAWKNVLNSTIVILFVIFDYHSRVVLSN